MFGLGYGRPVQFMNAAFPSVLGNAQRISSTAYRHWGPTSLIKKPYMFTDIFWCGLWHTVYGFELPFLKLTSASSEEAPRVSIVFDCLPMGCDAKHYCLQCCGRCLSALKNHVCEDDTAPLMRWD
ncbi:hypothetical protein KC19_5G154300 [Ceratodon purpureus]|uniref:Uncharacterized protein n=1 Tax=Ceratodon purpureus TaxID=3225 RepID=A0A8T0I390_CERPU|nr:hypothetical protein KC19_5G154300 [Ceratodon purpureus]